MCTKSIIEFLLYQVVVYVMIGRLRHAIIYNMDYVVSINIPYGHMTMFDILVCLFENKPYQMIEILMQYNPHLKISFQLFYTSVFIVILNRGIKI